MIASRLADLFEKHGYGSTYTNPSASERLKIAILCFVDDTNLTNTGTKFETIQDILKRTQHDAQLWNDLLRASGGALELPKCFMQVITHSFASNGSPVVSPAHPYLVQILDRNRNKTVPIHSISPYATYRSLGTTQGISRHNHAQFLALQKKATSITKALTFSRVTHKQAWLHHNLCFIPAISYPLPICHLTFDQLHKLQTSYLAIFCNKIGLN